MGWNKDGSYTLDGKGSYAGIKENPYVKVPKKKKKGKKKMKEVNEKDG